MYNLVGKRFGKLVVIERTEDHIDPRGNHFVKWLCQCDCGKQTKVITANLMKQNGIRSCGCGRKSMKGIIKNDRKGNKYDLSGEYGIGYTSKGEEFWFDLEDYDKIKQYTWRYQNGYLMSKSLKEVGKIILFHRLILGDIPDNMVVDHKVHPKGRENKIDNRKQNLEIKTTSQNTINSYMNSRNTSGIRGVNYNKKDKLWVARIGIDNKRIYLGSFKNKEDAIKARKEAEEKYYGDYRFEICNKEE